MEEIRGDIIGTLYLYAATEGGRRTPTRANEHSCIFVFGEENFDCRLLLDKVGKLSPGDSATVPIRFLAPKLIVPRLRAGDKFKLRELNFIGDGVVDRVLGG